jgi:glycerophosphoryl diester phosphodiesterase
VTSGEVYLNIEMKEYSPRPPKVFVEPLVDMVRKYGMHEYSLYSSFRFEYLQVLPWDALSIAIQPTTKYIDFFNRHSLQPLVLPKCVEEMLPSEIMEFSKATAYACMMSELTPQRLEDIRMRNIHLSVYTISSIAEFEQARSLGAKAVVTDIPEELLKFRKNFQ